MEGTLAVGLEDLDLRDRIKTIEVYSPIFKNILQERRGVLPG